MGLLESIPVLGELVKANPAIMDHHSPGADDRAVAAALRELDGLGTRQILRPVL